MIIFVIAHVLVTNFLVGILKVVSNENEGGWRVVPCDG